MLLFILGLVVGMLVTVFYMSLCVVSKKSSQEIPTRQHNGQIFGYCQNCYEPVYNGDTYVQGTNKIFCLKCGFDKFTETNIRVANDKKDKNNG